MRRNWNDLASFQVPWQKSPLALGDEVQVQIQVIKKCHPPLAAREQFTLRFVTPLSLLSTF